MPSSHPNVAKFQHSMHWLHWIEFSRVWFGGCSVKVKLSSAASINAFNALIDLCSASINSFTFTLVTFPLTFKTQRQLIQMGESITSFMNGCRHATNQCSDSSLHWTWMMFSPIWLALWLSAGQCKSLYTLQATCINVALNQWNYIDLRYVASTNRCKLRGKVQIDY